MSSASGSVATRSWLRGALRAQEMGLLLVILLLGMILTFAAPTRELRERIPLSAGSTITAEASSIRVQAPGGSTTQYSTVDGYTLTPDERGILRVTSINTFLSASNLTGVAKDAAFFAVMAVGITGVIILGGIDLSVGSVYALAGVLGAMALHALEAKHLEQGGAGSFSSIALGLGVPCAVGLACGLLNGLGVVGLRVHPFIITLGGMAVYRGLAFVLTDGQSIGELPDAFIRGFFKASIGGVTPVPMMVMVVVGIAGAFFLRQTVLGRRSYAVGDNIVAARYAGISVNGIQVMWYAICGLLAGLAASMMIGYYGSASSDSGAGYELKVIASAVVGGASLSGGRGSAVGAVLGAIVIQMIDNGIVLLGLSRYTNIVIGLAIIVAVVVDQARARFGR